MSFTGEQDGDICLDKGSSMWKCLRFDTTCYGWGWEGWTVIPVTNYSTVDFRSQTKESGLYGC